MDKAKRHEYYLKEKDTPKYKEKHNAYQRLFNQTHPNYQKEYYLKNKDKFKEYTKNSWVKVENRSRFCDFCKQMKTGVKYFRKEQEYLCKECREHYLNTFLFKGDDE